MSRTADNKAMVDEFIQAVFTRGELDAIERYLAPTFVNHDPFPGAGADRDGFRQMARAFRTAFPDWSSRLKELIAEGELVAERFIAQGTHRGEIMGIAPTGRTVSLAGINIFRIKDGKITERWGRLDDLGFMQQLGVVSHVS
jgi:steroid delta-isomerase-like uncharacterized protein